jgi:hypothetical protein
LAKRLERVPAIPSVDHGFGAQAAGHNRQAARLSRLEIQQLVFGECLDWRVAEARVEEIEAPADRFSIPKPLAPELGGRTTSRWRYSHGSAP